jgi:sugar/nucleoside kinase (ribokinase family)
VGALLRQSHVVKLNDHEAAVVQAIFSTAEASLEAFCRSYAARFGWQAVCVTRGAAGWGRRRLCRRAAARHPGRLEPAERSADRFVYQRLRAV